MRLFENKFISRNKRHLKPTIMNYIHDYTGWHGFWLELKCDHKEHFILIVHSFWLWQQFPKMSPWLQRAPEALASQGEPSRDMPLGAHWVSKLQLRVVNKKDQTDQQIIDNIACLMLESKGEQGFMVLWGLRWLISKSRFFLFRKCPPVFFIIMKTLLAPG